MKTSTFTMGLALLASMMLSTVVYSESQSKAARQQITQAVASGNVQSVISALPTLENMWPQSIGEYFGSAEQIARFFDDAEDDPAIQQAQESLYGEVLDKHCPEDAGLAQATAYFDRKKKVVVCYFGFDNMRYNKSYLLAVSSFLGEIRDRRIPDYESKVIFFSQAASHALDEAGVCFASDLTDPVHIADYEKALKEDERTRQEDRLQRALSSADWAITSKLLYSCKQLRHDGKLDEEFTAEVAENAHLTEKEREMRFSFD